VGAGGGSEEGEAAHSSTSVFPQILLAIYISYAVICPCVENFLSNSCLT